MTGDDDLMTDFLLLPGLLPRLFDGIKDYQRPEAKVNVETES